MSATVASARPLKPSSSEGDDTRVAVVVEAPAGGDIQTVVGTTTTAEHGGEAGCGGHRFMSIDMLGGVKDSGPSPGAGH
ncbi:hypothetical protein HU200_058951 [Digitaria exilis]|uniref:Uncharacterized protein n=1 Tax=Digitaria exilis TaxID=1010633 RepID=A0A835E2Q5_9POAL|nr:hypothetical protein HU200_058951 [Digitaria exilis]